MREILFRGKTSANQWIERGYYKNEIGYYETNLYDFAVQPETIGQYTGLCDKNGTKIFEGDILVFDGGKGIVEMKEGSWSVADGKRLGCLRDMEIIGNIHDNSELPTA